MATRLVVLPHRQPSEIPFTPLKLSAISPIVSDRVAHSLESLPQDLRQTSHRQETWRMLKYYSQLIQTLSYGQNAEALRGSLNTAVEQVVVRQRHRFSADTVSVNQTYVQAEDSADLRRAKQQVAQDLDSLKEVFDTFFAAARPGWALRRPHRVAPGEEASLGQFKIDVNYRSLWTRLIHTMNDLSQHLEDLGADPLKDTVTPFYSGMCQALYRGTSDRGLAPSVMQRVLGQPEGDVSQINQPAQPTRLDATDLSFQVLREQDQVAHSSQLKPSVGTRMRRAVADRAHDRGIGFSPLSHGQLPTRVATQRVGSRDVDVLLMPLPVRDSIHPGRPLEVAPVFKGFITQQSDSQCHVMMVHGQLNDRTQVLEAFAGDESVAGRLIHQRVPLRFEPFDRLVEQAVDFNTLCDTLAEALVNGTEGFSKLVVRDAWVDHVQTLADHLKKLHVSETFLQTKEDRHSFFLFVTQVVLPEFLISQLEGTKTDVTMSVLGHNGASRGAVDAWFKLAVLGNGAGDAPVTPDQLAVQLAYPVVSADKTGVDRAQLDEMSTALRWVSEAVPEVPGLKTAYVPNMLDALETELRDIDGNTDLGDEAKRLEKKNLMYARFDHYLSGATRGYQFDILEDHLIGKPPLHREVLEELRLKYFTVDLLTTKQDEATHCLNLCLKDMFHSDGAHVEAYMFTLTCHLDGSAKQGAADRLNKMRAQLDKLPNSMLSQRVSALIAKIEVFSQLLAGLSGDSHNESMLSQDHVRDVEHDKTDEEVAAEVVARLKAFPFAAASILTASTMRFDEKSGQGAVRSALCEAICLALRGDGSFDATLIPVGGGPSASDALAEYHRTKEIKYLIAYGLKTLNVIDPPPAEAIVVRETLQPEVDPMPLQIQQQKRRVYELLAERLPGNLKLRQEVYVDIFKGHLDALKAGLESALQGVTLPDGLTVDTLLQAAQEKHTQYMQRLDAFGLGLLENQIAVPGREVLDRQFLRTLKTNTDAFITRLKRETGFPQKHIVEDILQARKAALRQILRTCTLTHEQRDAVRRATHVDEKSLKKQINIQFGQLVVQKAVTAVATAAYGMDSMPITLNPHSYRVENDYYQGKDLAGRDVLFESSYNITSHVTPSTVLQTVQEEVGHNQFEDRSRHGRSATIDPFSVKPSILAESPEPEQKAFLQTCQRVFEDVSLIIGHVALTTFCGQTGLDFLTQIQALSQRAHRLNKDDWSALAPFIRRLFLMHRALLKVMNLAAYQGVFSEASLAAAEGNLAFTMARQGLINGGLDEKEAQMLQHESLAWRFLSQLPLRVPPAFLPAGRKEETRYLDVAVFHMNYPQGKGGPQRYGYSAHVNRMGLNDLKRVVLNYSEKVLQDQVSNPQDRVKMVSLLTELHHGIAFLEKYDGGARGKGLRKQYFSKKPLRVIQRMTQILKILIDLHCKSGMDRTEFAAIMEMMMGLLPIRVFDVLDLAGTRADKPDYFNDLYQLLELLPPNKVLQALSRGVEGTKGTVFAPKTKAGGASMTTT